ncbi:S-adenosyl-L-methionine-dependent methyltransferase [Aspergillus sclerotioniger CBS 115572]|uniref:DNA (cytosine-5-)-methyltransferase n=1 Tax=Aspergillus sclerotioniger CBS 115572 TaxID=1450535 RepID=A0A317W6M0_9EURO|nr:S-adenosyl-L-methionine-dependent methyltransferase [Aspergillus sclerotioniger CBS 115572]PWY80907.1 S-adenosyl-L-methionine-dependent methyltransferase [Aspergillus sclerotioniger CBS 115572]
MDIGSQSDSSVTIDNDPDQVLFIGRNPIYRPMIDLTQEGPKEGDYLTDAAYNSLLRNWHRNRPATNPTIDERPKRVLNGGRVNGILYTPGQSFELHNGHFIRVQTMFESATGEVMFNGRHLIRSERHIRTYLPKRPNELIWISNEPAEIPFQAIKRFVKINFTNYCHVDNDIQKEGRPHDFFCRLKEHVSMNMQEPSSLEFISFDEADEGFRHDPIVLRRTWRGETRSFGAADSPLTITLEDDGVVDLTEQGIRRDRRQYTFGDGFCGAGGVSCGARSAGLRPTWAFDNSAHAVATYQLNFNDAQCEGSDVFNFLTNNYDFLKVDITHGSPPCQTFSPAKTVESANDDANSACIFSCSDLIRRARPRVHTMEETYGLLERHKDMLYRVIQDFVEVGYSVRWTLLNCVDFGVPQYRRRLVIIASGPGERLPPFPNPTHGPPGSGLLKYATINQVISRIPQGARDHDVEGAYERMVRHRTPFDPDQQARTITCGGGERNYHPSGERGFTNREFACLQTFPLRFRFGPREVRKQIGNAVPPMLAEALYKAIKESLHQTDAKELGQQE